MELVDHVEHVIHVGRLGEVRVRHAVLAEEDRHAEVQHEAGEGQLIRQYQQQDVDPVGRREIRELIAGLRETGTTVFMSTHILSDVEALCDEVAILRGGKLAANGKLSELLVQNEGPRIFEVVVSGDAGALNGRLPQSATVSSKPGGTAVEVAGDSELNEVLEAARDAGTPIVSVNPLRQSLEELFVESRPEKAESK